MSISQSSKIALFISLYFLFFKVFFFEANSLPGFQEEIQYWILKTSTIQLASSSISADKAWPTPRKAKERTPSQFMLSPSIISWYSWLFATASNEMMHHFPLFQCVSSISGFCYTQASEVRRCTWWQSRLDIACPLTRYFGGFDLLSV